MERSIFFLRTKLLPPRAVSDLLARPRLNEKLQANLGAPMTMVAADAGCGKTTLISEFIRTQNRPAVWYQLDHTDADPIVFLGYIARGVRDIAPDFGQAIFPYLSEASEELLRYPERAVDALLNEILQTVEQPFILVLDDYHHIGRDTTVHKLVDRMLQYSSDLMHVIITTRDIPPLALTRRRTQSTALVITRDDLLFTDEEVRELFRKTVGVELCHEEVIEYRAKTNGWITALQLVRQVAEQEINTRGRARPVRLNEILQQSERDIFDYFAEEVFSRESDETQRLLLHLSLLETLPLDLCGRLFPDLRCSAALPELARKNVFLTVASDGGAEEYRFHPLFREFLIRRFRSQIGAAGVQKEYDRIAFYFIGRHEWERAISFLIKAENFEKAAAVLGEFGHEWITRGALLSLDTIADSIPINILENSPRAIFYAAEAARLQGETEKSSLLLNRAAALLGERGDAVGEADALHSLASLARRRGRTRLALELLSKAESLAAGHPETFLKCANTRGLCLITEGNWAEAERQFRYALDLAEKQSNERYTRLITHNLALAPGFRGDFGEALRWFKRIFRDDQPDKQLPQEAIGHLNVARLHLYRGEFEESERHLERSLELCQLYNLKFLRGEVFEAYGNLYRERYDFARAEEYYERSFKAYEDAEIDPLSREYNEELAKFFRMRGDFAKARELYEKLLEARLARENTIGVSTARLGLCQVNLAERRTDGLIESIENLKTFFHDRHHYYDEAAAAMLLAETNFVLGRFAELELPVTRALDLAARFDYEYWLKCEIKRMPELFGHESVADRLPADLRIDAGAVVARTPERDSQPPTSLADLSISVLGHVEIFRDKSKPFAADAWITKRSRDIFCYIATSRHRRAAKDVLIEIFWPGEDPLTVEKNFHPTISHIRKALNSRQPYKLNFLVFRDGAYQLNPELDYTIDTETFEQHIVAAEAAKREKNAAAMRKSLTAAYELYRGEFMAGCYENWAGERREFYAEQYLRVLAGLAKLALAEKRYTAALKFADALLNEDPFREDVHRLIMKVHAAQARPASVKKQFDEMKKLLARDLGIDPSPETRRLYEELMK